MQRHFNYFILVFGTMNIMYAQNPNMEIAGFEYSLIPDLGGLSVEKYSMNLNFGKRSKKRAMIGFGVSYDYYDFIFNNASLDFNIESYEKIHNVKTRMFFKYFISSTWSANLLFAPSLSSNLKGSLSNEDFILNSMVTLSKKWQNEKKMSLLNFGVGYGTSFGKPQFIPVVSFQKEIDANWSYSLGVPRTKINYQFYSRHTISGTASFNGLFGNASSVVDFQNSQTLTDTKLQYNSLDTSLDYVYRIQPNWTTVIKIGYSPWNQLKILDDENNEIYDFETNGSIFVSMGLKFNLNK